MHGPAGPNESGVHGNGDDDGGHRVEMSLLPLKKRALNDGSGGGRGSSSGDSFSPSPKKSRIDNDCARATPTGHHREPAAQVASPEPLAEDDALSDAEKLRLSKGKWFAAAEASSVVAPRPRVEKLMHDGIGSGARFNEGLLLLHLVPLDEAGVLTVANATKTKQNNDVPGPRDVPFNSDAAVFGEAVQRLLAQLGATRPWFVYRKRLEKSDVCPNQNRLQVSCKRDSLEGCPITRCFSPAEMRRVVDKSVGLFVTTLDSGGERHTLKCKYLDSNGSYRFISDWKKFLKWNGLVLDGKGGWTRHVDVELWAFRSRELPRQPKLAPGGKPVQDQEDDHFHPDGSLGLVLLHHEQRRECAEHEERKGKGAQQPGGEKKDAKQQRDKRDAATSAAALGEALAGVGTTATSSEAEMVAAFGQSTSLAVKGMLRLRGAMLEGTR